MNRMDGEVALGVKDMRINQLQQRIAELEAEVAKLREPWVSVKDALPKEDGRHLVLYKTRTGNIRAFIGDFDSIDGKWMTGINEDVHYWMPLPEPPKEVNHG